MIKVLSVLPLENAIELYKNKFVENYPTFPNLSLSLIHISEPTRRGLLSRMPSSA